MDKKKFEAAILRIANLAENKRDVFGEDVHKYIDCEIIKAARALLTAAGDDIVGTPTPAGIKAYPSGKREFVCTKLSYRYDDAVKNTN